MNPIYLNSQLTACPSKAVDEKMVPFIRKRYDEDVDTSILEAYESLYKLASLRQGDHFVFTSSGSEAVNHAIFATYLDITRKTGKNHFITSSIDEAPTIMAMSRLQELGCSFEMAPASGEGYITVEAIAQTITPRTAMLSLSWANALTGVIQPVFEISELCRDRGVRFHVEGTQVLSKGGFTLEASGADILSFNGEQLHGPSGTGGLYIREGIDMSPMIIGGNEQEEMRGGSLNVAGLVGLGEAAKEALEHTDHICMEVARLRTRLEKLIVKGAPSTRILFKESRRLPNITAMVFPGVASDALLYLLNRSGVRSSVGGGHLQQIMHILKACGLKEPLCHSGLSFALSRDISEEEIEKGVEIIVERVLKLQSYSKHLVEENL